MGDGDSRARRSRQRRGYARNHFEWNAMLGQILGLFAAPPEQKRVPALEPHHHLAFAGLPHQHLADLFLAGFVDTHTFAQVDPLGRGLRQGQDFLLNQTIVDDDVAGFEKLYSFHSQQLGVAGAGAHQIYLTGRH